MSGNGVKAISQSAVRRSPPNEARNTFDQAVQEELQIRCGRPHSVTRRRCYPVLEENRARAEASQQDLPSTSDPKGYSDNPNYVWSERRQRWLVKDLGKMIREAAQQTLVETQAGTITTETRQASPQSVPSPSADPERAFNELTRPHFFFWNRPNYHHWSYNYWHNYNRLPDSRLFAFPGSVMGTVSTAAASGTLKDTVAWTAGALGGLALAKYYGKSRPKWAITGGVATLAASKWLVPNLQRFRSSKEFQWLTKDGMGLLSVGLMGCFAIFGSQMADLDSPPKLSRKSVAYAALGAAAGAGFLLIQAYEQTHPRREAKSSPTSPSLWQPSL